MKRKRRKQFIAPAPAIKPCPELQAMLDARTWQEKVALRGWMCPALIMADEVLQGRWDHWCSIMSRMSIGEDEIPPVHWCGDHHNNARKVWERTLNAVTQYGGWQGWSSWRNVDFLFDWLLFGFGHKGIDKPREDGEFEGATMRILDVFDLPALLREPNDYLGDILADNAHGKHMRFYPTPMSVTRMMVAMTLQGDEDMREKSVCDPCVGTGRMLLAASDYSYRLYGADIDGTVIKATLINGYLYAPWLVRPFPWLELADPVAVSDSIAAQAPEHLAGTEHDPVHGHRFLPIAKRRKVGQPDIRQGVFL
ncbi:MAG TPA: N-6 DNA methylase [Verrucomicrobiae bacterium]|nr:N-6 DNA methylase [Verrucomicrobiae bacterium]